MLFICYAGCSTCKRAQALLEAKGLPFESRDIKFARPSEQELREWQAMSGLPVERFFNTSGLLYRALELKDKLPVMTESEKFRLLASDGMLVKRPILVADTRVFVGFREAEWSALA